MGNGNYKRVRGGRLRETRGGGEIERDEKGRDIERDLREGSK